MENKKFEFDLKTLVRIEEALGWKMRTWQIDYLMNHETKSMRDFDLERNSGKTTTAILKNLLVYSPNTIHSTSKNELKTFNPIDRRMYLDLLKGDMDLNKYNSTQLHIISKNYIIDMNEKLINAGFKTSLHVKKEKRKEITFQIDEDGYFFVPEELVNDKYDVVKLACTDVSRMGVRGTVFKLSEESLYE